MISLAMFLSVLALADFSSFTYCHENTRGPYELQCIQLDSEANVSEALLPWALAGFNLGVEAGQIVGVVLWCGLHWVVARWQEAQKPARGDPVGSPNRRC